MSRDLEKKPEQDGLLSWAPTFFSTCRQRTSHRLLNDYYAHLSCGLTSGARSGFVCSNAGQGMDKNGRVREYYKSTSQRMCQVLLLQLVRKINSVCCLHYMFIWS